MVKRLRDWSFKMYRSGIRSRLHLHALYYAISLYMIVGGTIGFAAMLSEIPEWKVTEIAVNGANVVSGQSLIDIANHAIGTPLLRIVKRDTVLWPGKADIAAAVYASDPHIHTAKVESLGGHKLAIDITEESPSMLWCGSDTPSSTPSSFAGCWFANDQGTIYTQAPDYSGHTFPVYFSTPAPVFHDQFPRDHDFPVGYAIADDITMKRLTDIHDALAEHGHKVFALGVTGDADIKAFTEEGTVFLLGLSRDIELDMKRFEAVSKNSPGIFTSVDLRFPNKVFFEKAPE